MDNPERIFVTRPALPPLQDVTILLEEIWSSRILTNSGPLHNELEKQLATYLGVPYVSLFANGTLALIAALHSLRLTGEVITSPFSFVATAQALVWNNLKPVFADINPLTFGLDPQSVERLISPNTTAILPVHCYGIPCDINALDNIATNYNLKIIYDAAHCFGVRCHCGSILSHGDLSVLSFHATKVFNTFEGGAVVCNDINTKKKIDKFKNFGFVDEFSVACLGMNAKMSELNSAVGLAQLKYIDIHIEMRAKVSQLYTQYLSHLPNLELPNFSNILKPNYSYYPILFNPTDDLSAQGLYDYLRANNIYARRYFSPLISDFTYFKNSSLVRSDSLVNAKACSERVLCLPIYPDLDQNSINHICELIVKYCSNRVSI